MQRLNISVCVGVCFCVGRGDCEDREIGERISWEHIQPLETFMDINALSALLLCYA